MNCPIQSQNLYHTTQANNNLDLKRKKEICLLSFIKKIMLILEMLNFLVLLSFFTTIKGNPVFCSAYCSPNQCGTDQSTSGCTSCDNPMIFNSTANPACQIPTTSLAVIVGSELDGGLVLSPAQSIQTCGSGVQFSGWIDAANQISLSFAGSSIPHYKLTVIYWLVLTGTVSGSQTIVTTFDTIQQMKNFGADNQGNWCTDFNDTQYYFKITASYNHNLTTAVTLNIQIQTSSSPVYYGIKQYILLYDKCNQKCSSCSDSATNCYSCTTSGSNESFLLGNSCVDSNSCGTNKFANSVNHVCQDCNSSCNGCSGNSDNCSSCISGLYFLNNVCYSNCGIGYFQASSGYCITCSANCVDCDQSSTNCSSCQTTGPNQSFLKGTSCVLNSSCGIGLFPDTATHICATCDPTCYICEILSNNCTSCSGVLYLQGNACVSACSSGLYQFTSTNLCKPCNPKCIQCEGSSTNCSSCQISGPNQSFLKVNQCVTNNSCGTGMFPNSVNHVCEACNTSCSSCSGNTDNCTSCISTLYFLNNICYLNCPDGYYEKNVGKICDLCYSKCTLCDISSTNCSACQTSGANEAFLLANSCVSNSSCGAGKFANSVTHLCQACNTSCLTCSIGKDNCTSCTGALSLYLNSCVVTCPNNFYSSSNLCVACNPYCLTCKNSTFCYSCQISGTYQSFFSNNSCTTTCPNKTYGQISNHKCQPCDISCKLCTGNPSPCSKCNSSYFFFNNSCLDSCPTGYFQLVGNATTQSTCQTCNPICTACFGPSVNQCTACDDDAYKLSNTTCALQCDVGYGQTDVFAICVKCNPRCITCYNSANNCSACYTSGPKKGFYLVAQRGCYGNCPNGYYNNQTTITCQRCHTNCSKCSILPTNCTACKSTLFLLGNFCWDNCPNNYFENTTTNLCESCSTKCLQCQNFAWNCSVCNGSYPAFYLNNRCYKNCPDGYYNNVTTGYQCQLCNNSCSLCSGFPSPCSKCVQLYYLFDEVCYDKCPDTNYFEDDSTNQCLLCDTYCVDLTINMYFGKLDEIIYVDMNFSEQIDFLNFKYQQFQYFTFSDGITIDKFTVQYELISNNSYRIKLYPSKYIFLYNVTVEVRTAAFNGSRNYSIIHRPFKYSNYDKYSTLSWFVIKGPDMTDAQKKFVSFMQQQSQAITEITSKPYVQQLNKLGLIGLLFPGIQITSSTLLVHGVIPKNMYQGVRLISLFVFYDVPQWEKQSSHTKDVFSKPVNTIVQKEARLLAATSQWRLLRTGSTTYFIFDTYLQLMSIIIAWIILLGFFFYYRNRDPYSAQLSMAYSIFHRIHQLCIMYIVIAVVLEWTFFASDNVLRWVSLSTCIVSIIYFLVYQLKIYYDLHQYPLMKIGTHAYKAICTKYGYFLTKIRFQQYPKDDWFFKLWFRPYNYHVLSFYKKILMMAALPIFHDNPFCQISILCTIQILEIIRFLITWPFAKKSWNIFKLCMQFLLLLIFVLIMSLNIITTKLMSNDQIVIQNSTRVFYGLGWFAFSLIVLYNVIWMVVMFISFVSLCRQTYKKQMEQIRKQYYFQKITQYEQQNQDVQKSIIKQWIRDGNLNEDVSKSTPQQLTIKIEQANIKNFKTFFEIKMRKTENIYIKPQDDFILEHEKRVVIKNPITKIFEIGIHHYPQVFNELEKIYLENQINREINIKVSIYVTVELSEFKEGGRVALNHKKKWMRISYHEKNKGNEKEQIVSPSKMKRIQLKQCKYGFPFSNQLIKTL